MPEPVICFGQQPSGFLPKRFLYAKIKTARDLQKKIGGRIVFFYHDADADYRETITVLDDVRTGAEVRLNFTQENKTQKKYSPLYLKRIPAGWREETARRLPRFVPEAIVKIFSGMVSKTAGDFCLELYQKIGLLDGIEVVRSGDPAFRREADDLKQYFADIPYQGETVRAELHDGAFRLHEGGGKYFDIPAPADIPKEAKNPGRDERFRWMQSVVHATHYVYGAGEGEYLKMADFPEVTFVEREKIDRPEHAWIPGAA